MNLTSFAKKAGIVLLFCFVIVAIFSVTPASAYVPLAPSVPGTGGGDGSPGGFLSGLINFAIGFSGVLAVLMIVWGGVSYITAAGDTNKVAAGRERITSAILGLILILTSWLVLNTINPELVQLNFSVQNVGSGESGVVVGSGSGEEAEGSGAETSYGTFSAMHCRGNPNRRNDIADHYQRFLCFETRTACEEGLGPLGSCSLVGACSPVTTLSSDDDRPPYQGYACDENKYGFCEDCVELPSLTLSADTSAEGGCSSGYTCFVNESFGEGLEELSGTLADDRFAWKVTKAWPPTESHRDSSCHKAGTCVDANFVARPNPYEVILTDEEEEAEEFVRDIIVFIRAADEAGLRAEYKIGNRDIAERIREISSDVEFEEGTFFGLFETTNTYTLSPSNVKYIPSATEPHFTIYE